MHLNDNYLLLFSDFSRELLKEYESTKCILTRVQMVSQFMGFGNNSKINWQFKAQVNFITAQMYYVAIVCNFIPTLI